MCLFSLCCQDHFLACAVFLRFVVLPRQMFPHCLTGELRLTGVAKVPRQVERLTWARSRETTRETNASGGERKNWPGKQSLWPSTREVSSVTLAAFRRPAGRLRPRRSNFSRRHRPPFLDFALWTNVTWFHSIGTSHLYHAPKRCV